MNLLFNSNIILLCLILASCFNIVSASSVSITCNSDPINLEDNDFGQINLIIDGGIPPFQIEWTGVVEGTLNSELDNIDISNIPPGSYQIFLIDAAGNSDQCNVIVSSIENVKICKGECVMIGKSTDNCFNWLSNEYLNTPELSETLTCPTESMNYMFVVTDDHGDLVDLTYYNIVVEEVELDIITSNSAICNGAPLDLSTSPSNFSTYTWSNSSTLPQIAITTPGDYGVSVVNSNGCTGVSSIYVPDSNTPNSVENYLLNSGFVDLQIPLSIGGSISFQGPSSNNSFSANSTEYILDIANTYIYIDGEQIDIKSLLLPHIEDLASQECNPKVTILTNSSLCDPDIENYLIDAEDHYPSLGFIIFIYNNGADEGTLFTKVIGNCIEESTPNNRVKYSELPVLNCGKTFSEFKDLLTQTEIQLISHGVNDLYDQIDILRGIYYETTWSVDYSVENSEMRNNAFNIYCHDGFSPDDIRPLIGQSLYSQLFNCAEIVDGNKRIDFGHLIIGLDARAHSSSNLDFGVFGGNGPEIVTWLGDLGAAAGTLALRRINNPGYRAIQMFRGSSSFGASVNLEGDVAGFVLGWDFDHSIFSIYPTFEDTDLLSEILDSYLCPTANNSSEWHTRAKTFLKILGGEFDSSDQLLNKNELIENLKNQMTTFGDRYLLLRLYDNGQFDINKMIEASRHIIGASEEIAKVFVETLEKETLNPDDLIQATGQGPLPSSPGTPFEKYVNVKSVDEWLQWLKDKF